MNFQNSRILTQRFLNWLFFWHQKIIYCYFIIFRGSRATKGCNPNSKGLVGLRTLKINELLNPGPVLKYVYLKEMQKRGMDDLKDSIYWTGYTREY